ncbi:MAG: hypothetical protein HKN23_09150, partial [Verrucomicrobiales bacterium]|nr:hypothetical protein [Verrucomicrobiales bacterium]
MSNASSNEPDDLDWLESGPPVKPAPKPKKNRPKGQGDSRSGNATRGETPDPAGEGKVDEVTEPAEEDETEFVELEEVAEPTGPILEVTDEGVESIGEVELAAVANDGEDEAEVSDEAPTELVNPVAKSLDESKARGDSIPIPETEHNPIAAAVTKTRRERELIDSRIVDDLREVRDRKEESDAPEEESVDSTPVILEAPLEEVESVDEEVPAEPADDPRPDPKVEPKMETGVDAEAELNPDGTTLVISDDDPLFLVDPDDDPWSDENESARKKRIKRSRKNRTKTLEKKKGKFWRFVANLVFTFIILIAIAATVAWIFRDRLIREAETLAVGKLASEGIHLEYEDRKWNFPRG